MVLWTLGCMELWQFWAHLPYSLARVAHGKRRGRAKHIVYAACDGASQAAFCSEMIVTERHLEKVGGHGKRKHGLSRGAVIEWRVLENGVLAVKTPLEVVRFCALTNG